MYNICSFILWNFLELFFMLSGFYYSWNYASIFCVSLNTDLWTLWSDDAIKEAEIKQPKDKYWIKAIIISTYNITMIIEIAV